MFALSLCLSLLEIAKQQLTQGGERQTELRLGRSDRQAAAGSLWMESPSAQSAAVNCRGLAQRHRQKPYPACLPADDGLRGNIHAGFQASLSQCLPDSNLAVKRKRGAASNSSLRLRIIVPRGPGCATRQAGCALAAHWIIAPEQRNSAISWLADFFQIFGRGHFVGEFVEPLE